MADSGHFSASERTPGQSASRLAYQEFLVWLQRDDVVRRAWADLMDDSQRPKWLDWRKAMYIIWLSMPAKKRVPKTQKDLAVLLGLRADEVFRQWRRRHPELMQMVQRSQVGMVQDALAEILSAAITVGSKAAAAGHNDRKMLLEMAGLYKAQSVAEHKVTVKNLDDMLDKVYAEPGDE